MGTGRTWTVIEQKVLCTKWIAASENPSVGYDQKVDVFWVAKLLNEGRQPAVHRPWTACKSHFHNVISPKVSKFMGNYEVLLIGFQSNVIGCDSLIAIGV